MIRILKVVEFPTTVWRSMSRYIQWHGDIVIWKSEEVSLIARLGVHKNWVDKNAQ